MPEPAYEPEWIRVTPDGSAHLTHPGGRLTLCGRRVPGPGMPRRGATACRRCDTVACRLEQEAEAADRQEQGSTP